MEEEEEEEKDGSFEVVVVVAAVVVVVVVSVALRGLATSDPSALASTGRCSYFCAPCLLLRIKTGFFCPFLFKQRNQKGIHDDNSL